jgi:hypothetical protein
MLLLLPVGEGSGKVFWLTEGTSFFSPELFWLFDVIFISWGRLTRTLKDQGAP